MASSSTRPKALRIGHMTWSVEWIKESQWEDKDKAGMTKPMQQRILMRLADETGPYSEGNLKEILVHECLHAIYHITNLSQYTKPKDGDIEEYTVSLLAGPMLSLMKDNPGLVRYLTT